MKLPRFCVDGLGWHEPSGCTPHPDGSFLGTRTAIPQSPQCSRCIPRELLHERLVDVPRGGVDQFGEDEFQLFFSAQAGFYAELFLLPRGTIAVANSGSSS